MKIPLLDDGRVDIKTLRDQVDWDHVSAFQSALLTYINIDWDRISEELRANPKLAQLVWEDNQALLEVAAHDNQFEVVKLLVECGADVDILSKSGTPVFGAVWSGNPEIVKYLINRGVGESINFGCDHGWTPLHKAARKGYLDIVEILIDAGADVNSIDDADTTPLDHAADFQFSDVAKLLILHHAQFRKAETEEYIKDLNIDE
ncbi:ankyrin repeat domain-containing protein [Gimesia chilikensis]|uniref:ankyrin repeat domain-containing protein n=1 Tax=Gimesia chilikensis TaxID=2605989 RepID=UPI001187F5D1|nr:ankyrin repeat domain-containing protein [Gimesia chilikensis]MCR9235004.1 ankyrin repeat domain-containing protein [bacterium]QDT87194.1 Ankyrin repeats (3 copies) [Gimesia chilikensis]